MNARKLDHPQLMASLRLAYSAERAAAFAYVGHAASLRDPEEQAAVRQIELDEWAHRRHVGIILEENGIPVSKYLEWKYWWIGKLIGLSCFVIGRFMPYFFAGKLESGNVCEYFIMIRYFHALGVTQYDGILHEMGIKEKEHEVFFQGMINGAKWLPLFEWLFNWGADKSLNDVDLNDPGGVEKAENYCREYKRRG